MAESYLSVGEVAKRSGLPISTLHFYERQGLIASTRNSANHRVYRREVLRRVTVIKIAQSAGVPLSEIAQALSSPVFVKQVVRRFHAASLISGALISVSGLSQTGPAGSQFRVLPDQRCGFWARAFA